MSAGKVFLVIAMASSIQANGQSWDIDSTPFPGPGVYDSVTSQITSSDVCTGKSILGQTGSRSCQSGATAMPAGAAHIIFGKNAWDSSGTMLTGTMPSHGAFDPVVGIFGQGFFGQQSNAVIPSTYQIAPGQTFLGIAGGANILSAYMNSSVPHALATSAIPVATEGVTYAGTPLPNGYYEVPNQDFSHDSPLGTAASSVATAVCGTAQNTIALRIADCAAQNGAAATWHGNGGGFAGQGVWKLVTYRGATNWVWRDERTLLLWSSPVANTVNWCRASGNNNSTAVTDATVKDADPNAICTNALNQETVAAPNSVCAQHAEFTPAYAVSDAKGQLHSASTPAVRWRLPTLSDYMQAEVNGLRAVFPFTASGGEWTATTSSAATNQAYFFDFRGLVSTQNRNATTCNGAACYVRCVGR